MSYSGETYLIPFNRGGLYDDPNFDNSPPFSMIAGSKNLNLDENGRGKRGGTALIEDYAVHVGKGEIKGLYDFTLENGNSFVIRAISNGNLYKNSTGTIKTGMSTSNYFCFETFENELFICDGITTPQTWDGSAALTSNITSTPTDWADGNNPQQMVKHGYGNSERMWALGCPSTPHKIYASANGDANDFSDGNVVTLYIETGDGHGIVGGIEYGDRLIVFGKKQSFIIMDTDASTANWGYKKTQFKGGVAHWRLLIETPTDIVAMSEDGEIYSVIAAENYGDYKQASLTRPSFMHKWIKNNVKLSAIDDFHGIYDPVLKAVKIFIVRNGMTKCDTALVYFVDRPTQEAWMIHDNQEYDSGYSASCSALVRESAGAYKIYTGNYLGAVWELETSDKNDEDNGYYAGFTTPFITFDLPRIDKNIKRGWLSAKPFGDYSVYINCWLDNQFIDNTPDGVIVKYTSLLSLLGDGAVLDSFVLDTDALDDLSVIDADFSIGNKGVRLKFEIYNSTADEDFYFTKMMIDYKPLSSKPAK